MNTNFYSFIKNNEREIEVVCPSCSQKNPYSLQKCSCCSYDLSEVKAQLFSHYSYFNKALELISKEDFISAFDHICKFIAYDDNDESSYKVYIFLLVKLGFIEKAKVELEKFESKFPRNPWIMIVERDGIENLVLPQVNEKEITFNIINDQLNKLYVDYVNNRVRNINELASMVSNFYDILAANRGNLEVRKQLLQYFEKVLIPVLSRREIRVEMYEGKNVDELSNEQMQEIDVKSTIEHKLYPNGTIFTLSPGIYVRSLLIKKQQILVVSNPVKEKPVKKEKTAKIKKKGKKK